MNKAMELQVTLNPFPIQIKRKKGLMVHETSICMATTQKCMKDIELNINGNSACVYYTM